MPDALNYFTMFDVVSCAILLEDKKKDEADQEVSTCEPKNVGEVFGIFRVLSSLRSTSKKVKHRHEKTKKNLCMKIVVNHGISLFHLLDASLGSYRTIANILLVWMQYSHNVTCEADKQKLDQGCSPVFR